MSFVTWDLHNLNTTPPWRGAIDHVDGERIRGWAISAANPSQPVPLDIQFCGIALPSAVCNVTRNDIARLFDVPTRAGFDLPISDLPADIAAALLEALSATDAPGTLADHLQIRVGGSALLLPFSPGVAQQPVPRARLQQVLAASLTAKTAAAAAREHSPLQVIALLHRDLGPRAEPGLTADWTQIAAARALFPGHVQPRLPRGETGFYDSRSRDTLSAQIAQARAHGITGFCYETAAFWDDTTLNDIHSAWNQHLEIAPDFGFCLHWKLTPGRAADQARTLMAAQKILTAPCYIRLAGRPLLLVSGLEHLDAPAQTLANWRKSLQEAGVAGLHVSAVESPLCPAPLEIGAESSCPLWPAAPALRCAGPGDQPFNAEARLGDYAALVAAALTAPASAHLRLGCALPGFDDSPLRGSAATVWHGATPTLFAAWVGHLAQNARRGPQAGRAIVLNAWNGWAKGNYLEPDQAQGFAWLQALRDGLAASGLGAPMSEPPVSEGDPQRQLAALIRANAALTCLLQHQAQPPGIPAEDHGGFVATAPDLLRVTPHPGGRAQLDRVNGEPPAPGCPLPIAGAGGLAVSGWALLPETDAFPALLALHDGRGQRQVALLRHALPHADDPQVRGFRFRGSLQAVPPGRYQLEILRPDRADPGLALSVDLGCEILIG